MGRTDEERREGEKKGVNHWKGGRIMWVSEGSVRSYGGKGSPSPPNDNLPIHLLFHFVNIHGRISTRMRGELFVKLGEFLISSHLPPPSLPPLSSNHVRGRGNFGPFPRIPPIAPPTPPHLYTIYSINAFYFQIRERMDKGR